MADFFFCFNSIIMYTTIKKVVSSIKKEIKKANDKENYFDEDEKILIRNFIIKIKKELELN